jgi:hypothetical protein
MGKLFSSHAHFNKSTGSVQERTDFFVYPAVVKRPLDLSQFSFTFFLLLSLFISFSSFVFLGSSPLFLSF